VAWKNPAGFLESCSGASEGIHSYPLRGICRILRREKHFLKEDRIRFRICCVIFYMLFERCQEGLTYHVCHAAYAIPQSTFRTGTVLAHIINESNMLSSDKAVNETELNRWVGWGDRYQLLSRQLGGPGNLFLLPDDNTERLSVNPRSHFCNYV
jgi:hypothetical protein